MSRYDLTDFEWRVIEPLLPNKPRGVPRVDDRRMLNSIFWVLGSGAPWRDLPERYGPRTTCNNRFVRWRKAGVWDRLMDAITAAHDGSIQMIDSTSGRAHQQAATAKRGADHCHGRSRGGLTTKIHVGVDLAKSVFQIHGTDTRGEVVVRQRLSRAKLLPFFARLPRCLVGVETNYWAREHLLTERRPDWGEGRHFQACIICGMLTALAGKFSLARCATSTA